MNKKVKKILVSDLPNHPKLIGKRINVNAQGGLHHYSYQDVPMMRVFLGAEIKIEKRKNEKQTWVQWNWIPEWDKDKGSNDCGFSGLRVDSERHKTSYLDVLILQKDWCSCKEDDTEKWIFMNDGVCDCGINRHHYHCSDCGKVKQVG